MHLQLKPCPRCQERDTPAWVGWTAALTLIIFAVAAALMGCATPYRKPCSVVVDVTLADRVDADRLCREAGAKKWDDGQPIQDNQMVAGCAPWGNGVDPDRVITQDDDIILGHEFHHIWDRRCGNGR